MRYFAFAAAFLGVSSFLSAADPMLLNLLMPNAQVVAGVNVAKAKTSPFGQFILRQFPEDSGFSQFIDASGFDPRRDLQEVIMGNAGSHANGLVAARGNFNIAKITAFAIADGKHQSTMYNGAELLTGIGANSQQAMALFDTSFVVLGNIDQVKAAIDRRKTSNPVNPQLAAKVAMYGAADAWTVSLLPLSSLGAGSTGKAAPGPFNGILQGDLLKKVTESSGGVTFVSPVQVTGELIADTDQDATALGDVVKFLASMVQTNGGNGAGTLVQDLTVSTDGKTLKLAIAIPEAQLEQFIESGKSHSQDKVQKI